MYDKLIQAMRHCVETCDCPTCPVDDRSRGTCCITGLLSQAADAIEKLSKPKWISVEEATPKEFVSVQAHMTDAGPFPSVREAYLAGGKWYFPALNEYHPVDKWAEFSEPPKEGEP